MSTDVVVLPGADRVPHGFIDMVIDPSGPALTWKYIPVTINGCPVHFSSAAARVVVPAGPVSVAVGRPGVLKPVERALRIDVVVQQGQAVPVFYRRSWIKGDPGALTLQRLKGPSSSEKQWLIMVGIMLAAFGLYLLIKLLRQF